MCTRIHGPSRAGLVALLVGATWACGGAAGDDGDGDGGDDGTQVPDQEIGQMGIRRLTRREYDNTLRDLLGDDTQPSTLLPEDQFTPFDNDFQTQAVSGGLITSLEALAGDVATRLAADPARRDAVVGCQPAGPGDEACMRSFVQAFGRRVLRRTLTDAEVDVFATLGMDFSARVDDFYVGVEVVLRALLQDPEFVYRIERGTPVAERAGTFKLTGYEVATRLSYLITGSTPDDALLDRAASGELDSAGGIRDTAQALLDDARARSQVDRFHALWLGYHQLPHPAELTTRMRTETAALIDRVIFDDRRPWLDLFTADETYVDDFLAQHYGLPQPGSSEPTWVPYGDSGRRGILSHGAFLSVGASVADTSPTKRGILIRETVMCMPIPPPPPNVNADAPPATGGTCKWDRYAAHRSNPQCQGCHELIDPIGFGLENYDREGRDREHDDGEPGCTIDGDGAISGQGEFNGPAQLGALLVDGGAVQSCAVQQLYRFAMGREHDPSEQPILDELGVSFADGGHRFDVLVLDLVSHPTFGFRREEGP